MFLFDDFVISLLKCIVIAVILIRIICNLTMGFNNSNVCLVGKTVIVTGGNSGMGYQTSLILAGRGAKVIIADRNDTKESVKTIKKTTNNQNVFGKFIDLASLASVRQFAKEINQEEDHLNILINNAGLLAEYNSYTEDHLQIQMQTNHFGPFLLTHLLIDLLKRSAPSRIIFVSSIAAFTENLSLHKLNNVNDINWLDFYKYYIQYSNTKFCNLITSNCFAEKLAGTGVTCNSLHPGVVMTPLIQMAMGENSKSIQKKFLYLLTKIVGKTPIDGAQTHVYLAMSQDVEGVTGKFYADCKVIWQPFKAKDKALCVAIWKKSEDLVKLAPSEKI